MNELSGILYRNKYVGTPFLLKHSTRVHIYTYRSTYDAKIYFKLLSRENFQDKKLWTSILH